MRINIPLITLISSVVAVCIKTDRKSSVGSVDEWDMLEQSEILNQDNRSSLSEVETDTVFGDNEITPQQSEADFPYEEIITLVSRAKQDTEENPTGE
jgi:hypothetical protein